MDVTYIIGIVTVLVAWILGIFAKKSKFISNHFIPLQNLIIGVLSFVIDYIITKDVNVSLMFSGLVAGGSYDILKNLKQLSEEEK